MPHLTPDPMAPAAGRPPRMRIEAHRVRCDLGHVTEIELVMSAPMAVFLASLKAARCEECGSSKLFMAAKEPVVRQVQP